MPVATMRTSTSSARGPAMSMSSNVSGACCLRASAARALRAAGVLCRASPSANTALMGHLGSGFAIHALGRSARIRGPIESWVLGRANPSYPELRVLAYRTHLQDIDVYLLLAFP